MLEQFLLANWWMILLTFCASLYVLVKASDVFTANAEKIGLLVGIPSFVVGLTIVSVGTSLPELATSFIAVSKGESEVVAANVVGSNIANLLLVIGLVALVIRHIKVEWELIRVDLPLLMGSAFILSFMLWDGKFTFFEMIVGLVGYLIYVFYSLSHHHKSLKSPHIKLNWKIPTFFILSGVAIYLSAEYTINALIAFVNLPVAQSWGVNSSMVAITAVAVGTSLPEVSVSIAAARRKNFELALGNVIGSNIFNSFVVMGLPVLVGSIVVSQTVLTLAVPFMIAATLLYVVATQDREVSYHEGGIFLLMYALFVGMLFGVL